MTKRNKKDHRTSNLTRRQGVREVKQSFLIICEGEKTEPDYFKAFRMTAAIINKFHHRHGDDKMIPKTIEARTTALGNTISHRYMEEATAVLKYHKIDQATGLVDEASAKGGKGKAGVFKDRIKHDFRSPCYTTRWSDIPEAT